jgi:hypothetical protein
MLSGENLNPLGGVIGNIHEAIHMGSHIKMALSGKSTRRMGKKMKKCRETSCREVSGNWEHQVKPALCKILV